MQDFMVIGNISDDPFAIDMGHFCGQVGDASDLISLKSFANSEFCPRFISDETDFSNIGQSLGRLHRHHLFHLDPRLLHSTGFVHAYLHPGASC